MKKRLLTAWLIACMMISLVGQSPIVALAEGDDSRVIPMSDGLKEVLILDDASETPEAQGGTTAVEIPETQTEQDENATYMDQRDRTVQTYCNQRKSRYSSYKLQ